MPWQVRDETIVIQLERIGAAGSLFGIAYVVLIATIWSAKNILWGLRLEVVGVVLALFNLFAELVTLTAQDRASRIWRYVLGILALVGLIGGLAIVTSEYP